MSPFTPVKATASDVRTGHVIQVPEDGYRASIEVEYVHVESFTPPEGGPARLVYRFAGWRDGGERVTRGAGRFPDGRVYIAGDLRGIAPTFGALTGAPPVDTQI